jgi:hypothetical protein
MSDKKSKDSDSEGRAATFYVNTYNNPWKNEQGIWKIRDIFYETCPASDRSSVKYCLGLMDLQLNDTVIPSIRKIYINMDHIPEFEYEFAETYLGGWTHWQKLQKSSAVGPHIKEWKAEKSIKLKADAMKQLLATAKSDTKDSFQAAKFLAQKGYNVGEAIKKGKAADDEASSLERAVDEDLKRIGLLKVVK